MEHKMLQVFAAFFTIGFQHVNIGARGSLGFEHLLIVEEAVVLVLVRIKVVG